MSNRRLLLPNGPVDNLGPYLPGLLTIKNTPMSLANHFVFLPLFALSLFPILVVRAGRQLGKSRQIAARLILQCAFKPGQEVLVVLPLQEQSDRLSSIIFKPMIEDSPVLTMLRSDPNLGSVRRRDFDNRSLIQFSYAFLDAERVRSTTAQILWIDEGQDMDPAHVPILSSCLDGADEPATFISGSSKTKDTFLERSWDRSSQNVWQIKCPACGFDNVCCLEPDGHIMAMLGSYRDDISPERPGLVCSRCRKPVSSRLGRWVSRFPERADTIAGYHIPQPIMPGHCERPVKWKLLLDKMNGGQGFTTAKFYNEVLGEAFDSAFKLVSLDDLKQAAVGIGPNDERVLSDRAGKYERVFLGVDWGGGGEAGVSRTKIAAMGMRRGDIEVFGGAQFPPSTDRVEEARQIIRYAQLCHAYVIAHDYNGAGTASESVLTHLGWPESNIVPIQYGKVPGGKMIHCHLPGANGGRRYYVTDKSRSLQFLSMAIRQKRVRFFDYDWVDDHRPGLLYDFTNLVEDKIETPTGEVYRIRKLSENVSDDFAHAVNYGACALWEAMSAWPDLHRAGRIGPDA